MNLINDEHLDFESPFIISFYQQSKKMTTFIKLDNQLFYFVQ